MPDVSPSAKITIGTHNGKFHADEVVACAMLKQLPEYASANIVRTRDPSQLAECSIVVDVGGVFDSSTNRYDHHQRGFTSTFKDFYPNSKWGIKLSSAGLVYVHFGSRIISEVLKVQQSNPMIPVLFSKLYDVFISELDAIDNGVSICDGQPNYSINTGLSSRVNRLNPRWNRTDSDEFACFMQALSMAEEEFIGLLRDYAETWYPARDIVVKALMQRHLLHPSGCVFSVEDQPCPWTSHVHAVERLENEEHRSSRKPLDVTDYSSFVGKPLFCLYQRDDGNWSVQAVTVSETEQFKSRLPLPEAWRGLRDEKLSDVVGLPDCVFVHATGFLGVHKTRDGALYLANTALKMANITME